MNAAKAGAIARLLWAAVEPFDQRMLRHDYSDVAVLGKAVTRSRAWPLVGLAMHAANGAVFGVAYARARRRGTSAVTWPSQSTPSSFRPAPTAIAGPPRAG